MQHKIYKHLLYWGHRRNRKKGMENVFEETMDENFPDLRKETDIQVQKAQSKMGPKRYTPKHIIVTMTKGK